MFEVPPIVWTGLHLNEAHGSFPCVLLFFSVLLTVFTSRAWTTRRMSWFGLGGGAELALQDRL